MGDSDQSVESDFDQSELADFGQSDGDDSMPEETPIQKEASVIKIPEKASTSKKRKIASQKELKVGSIGLKIFEEAKEPKLSKQNLKNKKTESLKKKRKLLSQDPFYDVYKDSFGVRAVFLSDEISKVKNEFISQLEERYSGTTKLGKTESLKKLCLKGQIAPGSVVRAEMNQNLDEAECKSEAKNERIELRKIPVSEKCPKFC